jgi:hypothetical protein
MEERGLPFIPNLVTNLDIQETLAQLSTFYVDILVEEQVVPNPIVAREQSNVVAFFENTIKWLHNLPNYDAARINLQEAYTKIEGVLENAVAYTPKHQENLRAILDLLRQIMLILWRKHKNNQIAPSYNTNVLSGISQIIGETICNGKNNC